ncbi:hypothetical protein EGJ52_23570 [Pseudomonas luteola]|uniref:DUF6030 family protein n=1 Tax=Pseudomonas TaxID=286 RepID=UPI0002CC142F|nr:MULTISPECIES: DUF6030 family protein [Pseudomonas]ENA27504.1 hypothetical protein HMPREF1487_09160 [Pseudomonas sp. HPB0071]RRW39799.1 hypothetical protein EGJ52_23570 [Pseudomonas luteola]
MFKHFIFCLTISFPLLAHAELADTDPDSVCQFLAASDLKGRKWTDYGDGTAGCASDYKDIGNGVPLANNLAYYVMGQGNEAERVKLVMNANQPNAAAPAIKQLSNAASKLSPKALGVPLPDSVRKAIAKGEPVVVNVGSGEVEVLKDIWPSGKGYEIQVMMR